MKYGDVPKIGTVLDLSKAGGYLDFKGVKGRIFVVDNTFGDGHDAAVIVCKSQPSNEEVKFSSRSAVCLNAQVIGVPQTRVA